MAITKGVSTPKKQLPRELEKFKWEAGKSPNPNGRPKGSRNKLEEAFLKALYEDFKAGGVAAITACRADKPDVYLNVIAKVLPKQVDVKADSSVADLADGLHAVAEFLSAFAEEGSGPDHAGSLPDGSVLPSGLRAQTH
ncbi:DUF5681 domain-containing protein [Hyphomicrobium sp. ghe19]|uniref:DUF5681 domain-containing protein n=1 Tax=Hyphomicrobium sp. ghe19 TaxID=2682968 RepID=UPI001366D676|nr:hypothetical protein HYPP_01515 [Hyphomicrobium sp. ghe19]